MQVAESYPDSRAKATQTIDTPATRETRTKPYAHGGAVVVVRGPALRRLQGLVTGQLRRWCASLCIPCSLSHGGVVAPPRLLTLSSCPSSPCPRPCLPSACVRAGLSGVGGCSRGAEVGAGVSAARRRCAGGPVVHRQPQGDGTVQQQDRCAARPDDAPSVPPLCLKRSI
jgi:hypothetical protein